MSEISIAGTGQPDIPDQSDARPKFVPRKEIKALTSLRFFPAFAVVLYHDRDSFASLNIDFHNIVFAQAVGFFFVLSGFILTLNYQQLETRRDIFKFYLARIARIWPAQIFTVLLLVFLIPEVFRVRIEDVPIFAANLCLVHAWLPLWKLFFSYNAASWSNSTEMFSYFCFPLLLAAMRKRWYIPIAVATCTALAMIISTNVMNLPEFDISKFCSLGMVFIHPLSRIFEFASGMTAAALFLRMQKTMKPGGVQNVRATLFEIAAIAAVLLININSINWRYASTSWAGDAGGLWMQNSGWAVFGFAMLIFVFAFEKGWISRLFQLRPFVLLGELSFGLYMIHTVIITYKSINFLQPDSLSDIAVFFAVCFLSSHLMFMLVENPGRKLLFRLGSKLIDRTNTIAKKPAPEIASPKEKWTKISVIAAEAIALILAFYLMIEPVVPISPDRAADICAEMPIKEESFAPHLKLLGADAKLDANGTDRKLAVTLVWQKLSEESASKFFINVEVLSATAALAHKSYIQDPRRTHLKPGTIWVEHVAVPLYKGAEKEAKTFAVTLRKSKRQFIHAQSFPIPENQLSK